MARIIKRGEKSHKVWRGECQHCGCLGEWDDGETWFEHFDGEPYGATLGRCPQCGKEVTVKSVKPGEDGQG